MAGFQIKRPSLGAVPRPYRPMQSQSGGMGTMSTQSTVPPATTQPQTPLGVWDEEYWKQPQTPIPNNGLAPGMSMDPDGTIKFDSSLEGQLAQRMHTGPSASNGQFLKPDGTYNGVVPGGQGIWDPMKGKYLAAGEAPGTGGTGGTGATGGTGGTGSITTSITPKPVYTPLMTQLAVNQAVSDSRLTPTSVAKQFMRPGVSTSQSTKYRSAPALAAGFSMGAQQAAGIPLADNIANEQSLMAGQLAKHQEWTGLAQLLLKQLGLQQTVDQSQLGNLSQLLRMLGGLM